MTTNQSNIQPYYKNLIFREDFRDVKAVSDNGGKITETPTINNGLVATGDDDEVGYRMLTELYGASQFSMHLKGVKTTGAATFLAGVWNLSQHQFLIYALNNEIRFYVAGSLSGNEFVTATLMAGQKVDITVVYDGSLSNPFRARIYVDGVLNPAVVTATLPTSMTSPNNFFVVLDAGGPIGTEVGGVEIFDKALSAEEVKDLYEQDTYSEVDLANADIYLPLRSAYNDGVNTVTKNLGSLGETVKVNGTPDFRNPRGVYFDGIDDSLEFDSEVLGTGNLVLGALCTLNNTVSGRLFDNGKVLVSVQSTGTFFMSSDGSTSPTIANFATLGETFTIQIYRKSNGDADIYKNGEFVQTLTTGTPAAGVDNLVIGDRLAGSREWTGLIAEPFAFTDFSNFTPQQAKYLDFVLKSKLNI